MLENELKTLQCANGMHRAWGDVSGLELDAAKVEAARTEEMEYFHSMQAYTRVPRSTIA